MKTVIGQWANAGGGTLRLELSKYALVGGTTENAPRFYSIPLDGNGAIPVGYEIWANDELMPEGTSYRRTVFDSNGYIIVGPQQIWVCGTEPINLTPDTIPILPTKISVTITPASVTLGSRDTQLFTASVSNTTNQSVIWSAALGTITGGGVYTAPSVAATLTTTVTATAGADPTASATAFVTISVISISIMPGSATLTTGQTQTFTATVSGSSNQNVTWSTSLGTITAGGLYTAPSLASATTVTVTATSQADPSVSATVSISVQPVPAISVAIRPTSVTLQPSQTQQFSASVNNTINQNVTYSATLGTITSPGGLYTAPSVISVVTTATVTATSVADPTKTSNATVTLQPPTGATPIDLVTWMTLNQRTTQHLAGDPSAPYSVQVLDTDSIYPSNYPKNCVWQIKNKLGNPWDVHTYNSQYITHWITEDGDAVDKPACEAANGTSCWLYAKAYKRYLTPVNVMPRMYTPNTPGGVRLDNSGSNTVYATTNCETTSPRVITIGPVSGITTGPFKISWGGSIDNGTGTLASGPNYDNVNGVDTIRNQYCYTVDTSQPTGYADVEEYYFVQGWGEVAWYYYHGGAFVQKTVNTTLATGGAPVPNFPCGPGKSWFV